MDPIVNSIRDSFGLYVKYIKNATNRTNYYIEKEYEISKMDILEIKCEINHLYMSYLLTQNYTYNEKSPAIIGYNHLMKMIDDVKIIIKTKN